MTKYKTAIITLGILFAIIMFFVITIQNKNSNYSLGKRNNVIIPSCH